jgi:hypothetical protein
MKWENPKLIDLSQHAKGKDKNAFGDNCHPTGSSADHYCSSGTVAAYYCENGINPGTHCNSGGSDVL